MKMLSQLKGDSHFTVALEATDFPTRDTLKSLNFDVDQLPSDYEGGSTNVYLAQLFITEVNYFITEKVILNKINPYTKTIAVPKRNSADIGWRAATISERFNISIYNFGFLLKDLQYDFFRGRKKTKKDDALIESYAYFFVFLIRHEISLFGLLSYQFYALINAYQKSYKILPPVEFLDKVIREITLARALVPDIESYEKELNKPFDDSTGTKLIVYLSTRYSTEELQKLSKVQDLNLENIQKLNLLGYVNVENIIENKNSIPQEWLDVL